MVSAVVLVFTGLFRIAAWGFSLPARATALVTGPVPASIAVAGGLALVLLPRIGQHAGRLLPARMASLASE